jgi:cell division septum initiation protein DivIVA
MDRLDQAIATLQAENRRLENELKAMRTAIAALQSINRNGHRKSTTGTQTRQTMSVSARRRIAAAQRARWAKWKAQRSKGA